MVHGYKRHNFSPLGVSSVFIEVVPAGIAWTKKMLPSAKGPMQLICPVTPMVGSCLWLHHALQGYLLAAFSMSCQPLVVTILSLGEGWGV